MSFKFYDQTRMACPLGAGLIWMELARGHGMLNFGRCRFEFKSYTYTRPLSSLVDNTSPFCQAIRKHGTELP